jgi:hypothetical protein
MTRTRFLQYRWVAALAVFPTSFTLASAAQAQPDEDEASPPAEPPVPPPLKAGPTPAPVVTSGEAGATPTPAPLFEPMGPDTFPDRSRGGDGIIATLFDWKGVEEVFHSRVRGIHGGSLWLEPSFHGLQWPHNTHTGIGVSGMFWVDSGYEMIKRDQPLLFDSRMYLEQGRGLLRVTPTYVRGRFFVQGQAELVANLCQATSSVCTAEGTFTTDDLWIRVGHWNIWDLKVGRFEGWEVYHLGMGLDPYTLERLGAGMFNLGSQTTGSGPPLEAPSLYGVNYLHDRPSEGLAVGYAALHAYMTQYLRIELLGKWGSDNYRADNATGNNPYNYLGGRPTAIFDVGWFKFKAGAEYQKRTEVAQTMGASPGQPQAKKDDVEKLIQKGVGASAQFVIDPFFEFGVNAAIGWQSYTDPSANVFGTPDTFAKSYTAKSVGGFANVRLADGWLAGAGANWTTRLDSFLAAGSSANDYTSHLQGFAALQYLLAGQLYIKAVFAYAKATFQPSDLSAAAWNNYMYSGKLGPVPIPSIRIRLMYLY